MGGGGGGGQRERSKCHCQPDRQGYKVRALTLKRPSEAPSSMVTKWIGDHYVPGFAPTQRLLQSQITCRLYTSPLDETINYNPPHVYIITDEKK